MDKYQEYLLEDYIRRQEFIFARCCPLANEFDGSINSYGEFDKANDTFTIKQYEDINIVDYVLLVALGKLVTKVSVLSGNVWEEIKQSPWGPQQVLAYKIIVNFNKKITKIKFSFINGLVDDYILNLKYVEADKETYFTKQAQKKIEELLAAASIKHSTGQDLVNIYFQLANENVAYTKIYLFAILQKNSRQLMATYKVEDGILFKAISGLAYGKYSYKVEQYDKDDNLIIRTDYLDFDINPPYIGKPIVRRSI